MLPSISTKSCGENKAAYRSLNSKVTQSPSLSAADTVGHAKAAFGVVGIDR